MKRDERQARRQKYAELAEEAEKQALKSRDDTTRASWERMSREYRKLASET